MKPRLNAAPKTKKTLRSFKRPDLRRESRVCEGALRSSCRVLPGKAYRVTMLMRNAG